MNLIIRLLALVKSLLPVLFLAVLLGSAGFFAAIAIPVLGGMAALRAAGQEPITAFIIILLCCGLVRGLLRYAEQYCNHYVAFRLLAHIRDKVFRALRNLAPAKLEGRNKGSLISMITTDIELLEVFYAHTISPVLIAALVSLGMTLFIGQYHWALGLFAALGYLTVGVVLPLIIAKLNRKLGLEYRANFAAMGGFVLESLRGLREIMQFGAGKARLEEMEQRGENLSAQSRRLKTYEGLTTAISGALILLFSFGMLWLGTALHIEFDGILIATIAMLSSFGPVIALANLGSGLTHTFAAGKRVLELLAEEPVTPDITNGKDIAFTDASCENVQFSYEQERILDDYSIAFPKNKITGITGKSGPGKSTLLRLFMRFWDVQGGRVSLSGEDVRGVNTPCLRTLESFMTQDTQLFAGSIEENIKIAKPEASREEIIAAAKKASLHGFIESLPKGYETPLGELGEGLSGGERQRLGLARAFLHDAPFLLLDEPTSNLDSLNEAVILQSLRGACEDKTVVLVSHRVSTMGIADTVHHMGNNQKGAEA